MYHDSQGREIEDLEGDNMRRDAQEIIEEDNRLLVLVKELLSIDVFNFHGTWGPRHMTQPRDTQWDWKHHGFSTTPDGVVINEFTTSMETCSIVMDASEAEKLLSVLLEWWLVQQREMVALPAVNENGQPL